MPQDLLPDHFISVKGIRTRYRAAGDKGTPVILVHGLGGFVENWEYNITPLAQAHRVYAMDLPGFGQTDKTPLVRDFNVLVQFIHDFMETMDIDKASLVGNSMGGGLALKFVLDYPEKAERLVLVDNAGMGREVCTDFRLCTLPVLSGLFIRQGRKNTARLLEQLVYDTSVITQEFQDLSHKYSNGDGAIKALMTTLKAGVNIFGQKKKLTRQLLDRLHTIKSPVLVVWGKQDRILPVAHAHIAAAKIPGARLEIFDRCGHMPMYEHPEKFNRLALEFLAGDSIKTQALERSTADA